MNIEQFVMAYGVEQDRLRALLPDGFTSLRPVLRINAEIRDGQTGYLEFNTAVEKDGLRGLLERRSVQKTGNCTTFRTEFLEISFTRVGIEGGCPAERDNAGCFFPGTPVWLRPPEAIAANKEFCDCAFRWTFTPDDAHGVSLGKTLPAVPTAAEHTYPKLPCTARNAARIPCRQVLGAYAVFFGRSPTAVSEPTASL